MRVITALVILISLVQVGTALAAPLVVRCLAEKPRGGYTAKMQIDIALPESLNQFVLVTDPGLENPHVQSRRVGLGSIQITEWGDYAKTNRGRFEIGSRRREFVVTALPNKNRHTLVGFYLLGAVIYSIRAELGDKEKPFIAFDTFNNSVWKGKCD